MRLALLYVYCIGCSNTILHRDQTHIRSMQASSGTFVPVIAPFSSQHSTICGSRSDADWGQGGAAFSVSPSQQTPVPFLCALVIKVQGILRWALGSVVSAGTVVVLECRSLWVVSAGTVGVLVCRSLWVVCQCWTLYDSWWAAAKDGQQRLNNAGFLKRVIIIIERERERTLSVKITARQAERTDAAYRGTRRARSNQ